MGATECPESNRSEITNKQITALQLEIYQLKAQIKLLTERVGEELEGTRYPMNTILQKPRLPKDFPGAVYTYIKDAILHSKYF